MASSIVIAITIIAERYGTKVGGIIGTLPSTIVIAFLFIAFNRNVDFASESITVVPAEMGINIIFLFTFAILVDHHHRLAIMISILIWSILSSILFLLEIKNIVVSLLFYAVIMGSAFLYLERFRKIKSSGRVSITYTPLRIVSRGLFAGMMIAIAVALANIGEILSGIFSVFPAIFLSTMIIFLNEHGSHFAGGMGKSMILGTPSVVSYAISVHFFYPIFNIVWGTILSYCIALLITVLLLKIRYKIL